MATIHTPGSVLYRSSCTIILNSESMIDSKGKIMADRTTKYMMLRPVHPRLDSMYPPMHDRITFEVTVRVARIAEFLIDSRMFVRSKST